MTMQRRAAWFAVVPGLALLGACGGGGGAATLETKTTQAAAAVPRVVSSAETSRYIVDPPAPGDSTAFTESDIRSKFLADSGPGTTIQTIALARFTDKITLVHVVPPDVSVSTDPVDPQMGRIDHMLAIVVIGNGPLIPMGGGQGMNVAPIKNASIIAALDPVTGQLIERRSDTRSSNTSGLASLAVTTP